MPLLVLTFFIITPHWLNNKVRASIVKEIESSANLSAYDKVEKTAVFSQIDFAKLCRDHPPEFEKMRQALVRAGISGNYTRLRWGLYLSIILMGVLGLAVTAIFVLNNKARRSQDDLIRCYRLSWKISIAAALIKVVLLIPLLAYGTFEFSVMLADRYFPKLLILIIIGGVAALWKSIQIILKELPLEFSEPLSREVTPAEAPELWQAVRRAAERLQTSPPDHILIGMQLNFYVTELAVVNDTGRVEGRTLFLSHPLLKQLSEEEVVAVIGHELGHFMGEDTKLTREFYPMRLKAQATMLTMAQSGWVGWPSCQLLNFFGWCFGATEQATSRARELLADEKGAALTSPQITARALVKFQILVEAFHRRLTDAVRSQAINALDVPLQTIVREQLLPETDFWKQLFEKKLPHPLDSHPSLRVRLEALGQNTTIAEAQTMAVNESESAYVRWLSNHDDLFATLTKQAETEIDKVRAKVQVVEADYTTTAGKELLDRHFPEQNIHTKRSRLWFVMGFLLFLVAVCVTATVYIDELAARIIFGSFIIPLGLFCVGVWKRHRRAEFVLNANAINYTGWQRPLRFQDVKSISAQQQYSTVTLTFHLKEKQPPIWKFSVLRFGRKSVSFSFSGLEGKQITNAQTVLRYFARQTEP